MCYSKIEEGGDGEIWRLSNVFCILFLHIASCILRVYVTLQATDMLKQRILLCQVRAMVWNEPVKLSQCMMLLRNSIEE